MLKNIPLIINSISSDYSVEFIKGVSDYLKNKDANLIISQVQLPDEHFGIFEYQYWAGMKLLESECIDAIIVVTPIFVSKISIEKLSRLLEPISNKPIISISVPLLIPNSYCIKISSKSVLKITRLVTSPDVGIIVLSMPSVTLNINFFSLGLNKTLKPISASVEIFTSESYTSPPVFWNEITFPSFSSTAHSRNGIFL